MTEQNTPEQQPTPFNFWWPISEAGKKAMLWFLIIAGILLFIKGYGDVHGIRPYRGGLSSIRFGPMDTWPTEYEPLERFLRVFFYYFTFGVSSCYFIINFGRLIYYRTNRGESLQEMSETLREKKELEALRRRSEIKKLKAELGDDDTNQTDSH